MFKYQIQDFAISLLQSSFDSAFAAAFEKVQVAMAMQISMAMHHTARHRGVSTDTDHERTPCGITGKQARRFYVCEHITVLIGLSLKGRIGSRRSQKSKQLENRLRKELRGKRKQAVGVYSSSKANLVLLEPV